MHIRHSSPLALPENITIKYSIKKFNANSIVQNQRRSHEQQQQNDTIIATTTKSGSATMWTSIQCDATEQNKEVCVCVARLCIYTYKQKCIVLR